NTAKILPSIHFTHKNGSSYTDLLRSRVSEQKPKCSAPHANAGCGSVYNRWSVLAPFRLHDKLSDFEKVSIFTKRFASSDLTSLAARKGLTAVVSRNPTNLQFQSQTRLTLM